MMKDAIEKFRNWEWETYKKRKLAKIKKKDFTIIASNCGGTFIYYDMGLTYLTPDRKSVV